MSKHPADADTDISVDAAALFDLPLAYPLPRAASLRELEKKNKGRWTRISPDTARRVCDECILVLHENKGKGPSPRSARWAYRIGKRTLLLCIDHADAHRKDAEALKLAAERAGKTSC